MHYSVPQNTAFTFWRGWFKADSNEHSRHSSHSLYSLRQASICTSWKQADRNSTGANKAWDSSELWITFWILPPMHMSRTSPARHGFMTEAISPSILSRHTQTCITSSSWPASSTARFKFNRTVRKLWWPDRTCSSSIKRTSFNFPIRDKQPVEINLIAQLPTEVLYINSTRQVWLRFLHHASANKISRSGRRSSHKSTHIGHIISRELQVRCNKCYVPEIELRLFQFLFKLTGNTCSKKGYKPRAQQKMSETPSAAKPILVVPHINILRTS